LVCILVLFRSRTPHSNAPQDYIVNHWSDDSGDPWEEIKAQVFFVKHTYRHACILGAKLASYFNDSDFAAALNATARSIEQNINSMHWSDAKGYVMEIPNQRELDSAVHLAFLYGDSGDGFLTPGSSRAQSSVGKFMAAFSPSAYPTFSINAKDDAAKVDTRTRISAQPCLSATMQCVSAAFLCRSRAGDVARRCLVCWLVAT
jgi:hypothetical protein